MEIIFLIPLGLFLPIALLFFTGYPGFAEKISLVAFLLLVLESFYLLIKDKGKKIEE